MKGLEELPPTFYLVREYIAIANSLVNSLENKQYKKFTKNSFSVFLRIPASQLKIRPDQVIELNTSAYITSLVGENIKLYAVVIEGEKEDELYVIRDDEDRILRIHDEIMDRIKEKIREDMKAEVIAIDKIPIEYEFYLDKNTEKYKEKREYEILGERVVLEYYWDVAVLPTKEVNRLLSLVLEREYVKKD